ncbi:8620_t:CDS:1, partial [Scutellospora calospora]
KIFSSGIFDYEKNLKRTIKYLIFATKKHDEKSIKLLEKVKSLIIKKNEISNDNYNKYNNKWKKFFKKFLLITGNHSYITNDMDNVKIVTAYNDLKYREAISYYNKASRLFNECNSNEVLKEIYEEEILKLRRTAFEHFKKNDDYA